MALFVDIEKNIGDFQLRMKFSCGDERTALLGASGAGKSMTLKCIAGIETPDKGRIVLDGRTLFDSEVNINVPPQKRKVGYLFQDYALFPNMTVYQNILCSIRKDSSRYLARKQETDDMIRKMNLEQVRNNKATELSGGQKQRVALARILINDADIMLLDEPFSALDEHLKFRLYDEVERVIEEFGKTVLLVTHDRDEAYRLSDRLIIVDRGRIDAADTVRNIFDDPVTVAGARLTGVKNIAPAHKTDDGKIAVEAWNMLLDKPAADRDVTAVAIRMHSIKIKENEKGTVLPAAGPDAGAGYEEKCTIESIREMPFTYVVAFKGQRFTQPLLMEVPKDGFAYKPGNNVTVSIDTDRIMVLGGNHEL